MASIAKITNDMLPDVYALLGELNPDVPESTWASLFTHGWKAEESHGGYVLVHAGKPVGILGTIFSERTIAGRPVRFCNAFSWYVRPEHRAGSVLLLRPLLALKGHTLTDFSAAPVVTDMLRRFGFRTLDREAVVLLPFALSAARGSDCEVLACDEANMAEVAENDRRIFDDHRQAPCGHMLLRDGRDYCYAVYTRVTRHPLPYCLVHYLSNPALFTQHHGAARKFLMAATDTRAVVVESRLVAGLKVPYSVRTRAIEKLYRSDDVEPRHVDMLYSEMVLMEHSTLLSLRGRMYLAAKKYLPDAAVTYIRTTMQRKRAAGSSSS
jgi:hypothetical protein